MEWDGSDYQARFDALAASGSDVHGEADFVTALHPRTVLDAGCGTGRVAIELAARGFEVTGVDVDASMLATAVARAPTLEWIEADLTTFDLDRHFDLVVMAGNVPLFTAPGTEAKLVECVGAHVRPGGVLVSGFSIDRRYSLATYDSHCAAAGLVLDTRYATWDREPFEPTGTYAVSVHRRAQVPHGVDRA